VNFDLFSRDGDFNREVAWDELADFIPIPGLSYVEELQISYRLYKLEMDRGQPVRYYYVSDEERG
jgi:hypothetical protein